MYLKFFIVNVLIYEEIDIYVVKWVFGFLGYFVVDGWLYCEVYVK